MLQLCQIEYLNKIQSYVMAELYCMHMVAFIAECYLIRWLARLSNEVEIWPGVAGCVVFCSDNSTYQISQSSLSLSLVARLTAGWQDCAEISKMHMATSKVCHSYTEGQVFWHCTWTRRHCTRIRYVPLLNHEPRSVLWNPEYHSNLGYINYNIYI